jgi:chromosome segregation ATPase
MRSELEESQSKIKAAETQLQASQTELKASQSQLSGVQSQLSGAQAELTAARLEMTEMHSRLEQLERKRKSEDATLHSEQEQQDGELGRRPKVEQQAHSSGPGKSNADDLRSLIQAEVQAEIRRNSQKPSVTPSRLNSVEEGSHPGYYTRRPENPQQYSQRGNFYDPRDDRVYFNPRGDPRFDDRREYFMLPRFNY